MLQYKQSLIPLGAKIDNMDTEVIAHKADDVTHASFIYEGKRYTINNPYKNGGSLSLKGQLHSHTTNSDGTNTPSALVTAYKNANYDFVAITDHDYLTPDPSIAGIQFISGIEDTNSRHVTAYDVDAQSTSEDSQTVINFYRAISKLCSIAHPNWPNTKVAKPEMQNYYDYNFTEVYNATTNTYGENQWDWALSSGKKVFALATDDCHNVAGADFNKGWVVVKTDTNDKASILQSLRDGNFYSSTGNDLVISVDGQNVTASSLESSNFTFIGFNGRVLKTVNGVTTASYTIKGDELYVRVKSVKVSDSTIAWSQPIFIDCLGDDGRTGRLGFKGALIGKTTDEIIANNSVVALKWDTHQYDTSGFFNSMAPTKLTIPPGVNFVRLSASLRQDYLVSSTDRCLIFMKKNGQNFTGMSSMQRGGISGILSPIPQLDTTLVSAVVKVEPGDYFEVFMHQVSGEEVTVYGGNISWFSVEVVQ